MSDRPSGWPRDVVLRTALCVACAALAALTTVVPDWIERLLGLPPEAGPDGGDGELEWLIVLALAAASVASGWWARRGWQRRRLAQAPR